MLRFEFRNSAYLLTILGILSIHFGIKSILLTQYTITGGIVIQYLPKKIYTFEKNSSSYKYVTTLYHYPEIVTIKDNQKIKIAQENYPIIPIYFPKSEIKVALHKSLKSDLSYPFTPLGYWLPVYLLIIYFIATLLIANLIKILMIKESEYKAKSRAAVNKWLEDKGMKNNNKIEI